MAWRRYAGHQQRYGGPPYQAVWPGYPFSFFPMLPSDVPHRPPHEEEVVDLLENYYALPPENIEYRSRLYADALKQAVDTECTRLLPWLNRHEPLEVRVCSEVLNIFLTRYSRPVSSSSLCPYLEFLFVKHDTKPKSGMASSCGVSTSAVPLAQVLPFISVQLLKAFLRQGSKISRKEIENCLPELKPGKEGIFEELVKSYQMSRTEGQPDLSWPSIVSRAIEKKKWSFFPAILKLGGTLPDDEASRVSIIANIFSPKHVPFVEFVMSERCTKHEWITLLPIALMHSKVEHFVPLMERFVPSSLEEFSLRSDVLEKCSSPVPPLPKLINAYTSLLQKILHSGIQVGLVDVQESIVAVIKGKEDALKEVIESYQRRELTGSLESKWSMLISLTIDKGKLFLIPTLISCGASLPDDHDLKFKLALQIDPMKNSELVHQLLSDFGPSLWVQLLNQKLHLKHKAMVSILQQCAPSELQHYELRSDILQSGSRQGQIEVLSLADEILHGSGLLALLVRKGIKVCEADVVEAVSSFTPDKKLALKEMVFSCIENYSVSQTNSFWSEILRKALDAKNTSIIPFLFSECEASVPNDASIKLKLILNLDVQVEESLVLQIIDKCSVEDKTTLLERALCQQKGSLIRVLQDRILQDPSSILPPKFNLGKCISSLGHNVELLEKLLDCGVSIEGISGPSPLSVVLESPHLLFKTKIVIGSILLSRGAQIGSAFSACEPEIAVSIIMSLFSNSQDLAKSIAKEATEQVRACIAEKGLQTNDIQLLTLAIESGHIDGKLVPLASHCEFLCKNLDTFKMLHEAGCSPPPLIDVLEQKTPDRMKMACFLISKGSDVQKLQQEGSPVHYATKIAMETGNTDLLEAVCEKFRFPDSGKLIDANKQTPFHLAMRAQPQVSFKILEILSRCRIDTQIKDSHGKKAEQYGKGNDKRKRYLRPQSKKKMRSQSEKQASRYQEKEESKNVKENIAPHALATGKDDDASFSSKPPDEQVEKRDLSVLLHCVLQKDDSYFVKNVKVVDSDASPVIQRFENNDSSLLLQAEQAEDVLYEEEDDNVDVNKTSATQETSLEDFENATWEVECTEKVMKFLKNERYPKRVREAAIKKIQRLASGNWPSKKNVGKTAQLYEIKLTKAARILWEVAVQFSSRCTDKATEKKKHSKQIIHVYSEVIRLWDVVLDHSQLNHCIANIEKSRERGIHADIQLSLLPHLNSKETGENLPKLFLLEHRDAPSVEEVACLLQKFVPAASVKDDEYNVVTFYSVSTALVNSMLNGEDVRRDFPFKEWPKEHDIINMPMDQEAILLLGRSGTGKTTCCLYRLWNHFRTYWEKVKEYDGDALYARNPLPIFSADDSQNTEDLDDPESATGENTAPDSPDEVFDEVCSAKVSMTSPDEFPIPQTVEAEPGTCSTATEPSEDDCPMPQHCSKRVEHLHQVFVTKNYVLCAQMKKRFYDMAASHSELADYMQFENQELPHSFDKVDDKAFPLFLTSRQFLTMLDNSVCNGETFFPRNPDGSLAVKVHSLDYDHEDPDTLLDLEGSGSEEEEEDQELANDAPTHQAMAKQDNKVFTEVTAAYFVEEVWRKISHGKNIDPLLVWMEIKSFIKGSAKAMQSFKSGYLSKEGYEVLGRKLASNFVGSREEIYHLFESYQAYLRKHRDKNLFDECQLVHSIYQRLSQLKTDLNWSVHHFYIDEVQDFTQAELSLFLQCCRDPNGLFLTGDTAQSIMRGIAFRFSDLRTLFHEAKKRAEHSKYPLKVSVPQILDLTINFRSHSGILQLAASIINLLKEYFPASFDRLPDDKGMFPGPKPVLLESCQISDLALLLQGNKRESSAIEFGAHQVIIVQTDEAKKNLPESLKAAITLTVFESKGLEFDDVLLYNFFRDSPIEKHWRLVTTFADKVKPRADMSGKPRRSSSTSQPRALEFDEQIHKSLNSELKYLYTAITRAKCNLWIYDADESKRLPIFDYWKRLKLVKVVSVGEGDDDSSLFSATSTPEQWKQQGDYFRKKALWEPAMKCYKKAGDELLEKECNGFLYVKRAKQAQNPHDFQEFLRQAAELFLMCDQFQHDYKYLQFTAKCLRNAKRYSEAAKLFERLGEHDLARRGYHKAKDYPSIARLLEDNGNFSGAVRVFKRNDKRLEALQRAKKYEEDGHILDVDVSVESLANEFAEHFANTRNREKLRNILIYVPEPVMRVKYLKVAKMYEDAAEELMKNNSQSFEAYQLILAHKLFDFGMRKARQRGDNMAEAKYLLQKATSLMMKKLKMSEASVSELKGELDVLIRSRNEFTKAQALLLCGKLSSDPSLCQDAEKLYGKMKYLPGRLQAFNEVVHLSKDQKWCVVAYSCILAGEVALAILNRKSASDFRILHQALQFYQLETYNKVYLLSKSQDLWANLHETKCKDNPEHNGMLRLQPSEVHQHLHDHFRKLAHIWLEHTDLEAKITERLTKYPFHSDLYSKGFLPEPYKGYLPEPLNEYLKILIAVLELKQFDRRLFPNIPYAQRLLLFEFFAPHIYLRLPVEGLHKKTLKSSKAVSIMVGKELDRALSSDSLKVPNVSQLFKVWRACSIFARVPEMEQRLERFARTTKEDDAGYTLTALKNQTHHFFWYWIYSCKLIRERFVVVGSMSFIVYKFISIIARRKSLRESTASSDLVYVSTLCSTALLSVIGMLSPKATMVIPKAYQHIVKLFSELNIQNREDHSLFSACSFEVHHLQTCNKSYVISQYKQAISFLECLLDILLGLKYEHCHVLEYVLWHIPSVNDGSAAWALSLTLCLVANLLIINRTKASDPYKCLKEVYITLKEALFKVALPPFFRKAYESIGNAGNVADILKVVRDIHTAIEEDATLCTPVMPPVPRKGILYANILKPLTPLREHEEISITPLAQATCTQPFQERTLQQGQDQATLDREPPVQRVSSLIASAVDDTLPVQPDPRMYLTPGMQEGATDAHGSHLLPRPEQEPDVDEIDPPIAQEKMVELLPRQVELTDTPSFMHSQSIEDTAMVDKQYCGYCGLSLRTAEPESLEARIINEATEERTVGEVDIVASDMPTYEEHVKTAMHMQKKVDYSKYKDFKDKDLDPLLNEITALLSQVEQAKQPVTEAEKCRQELSNSLYNLEKLKGQQNWGECCRHVEKSLTKFDSMRSQLKKTVEELSLQHPNQQEHPSSHKQQFLQPPDDVHDAEEDGDDQEDDYGELDFEEDNTRKHKSKKRRKPRQQRR